MSAPRGPQWMTTAFYPVGSADYQRTHQGIKMVQESLAPEGAFTGDNMMSWGKSLSFATDRTFFNAFMAATPDPGEQSLVWRIYTLYWAARRALELEGDFVELGVYRGLSSRVIASAVDFAKLPRRFWLYDIFGVPSDPAVKLGGHFDGIFEMVAARFADVPNAVLVKGPVEATMREASNLPDRVAFLHIDMNSASAEIAALEVLYERISPGALVVLDDYGWSCYAAQKAAHDKFWGSRGKMIYECPTGQGIVLV